LSAFDPAGIDSYEAGTRRAIAYAIAGVFVVTVVLVFATLWWHSSASKDSLAVLAAVIGVVGAVTGYYFAKGD
jgi:hypothetical protein